MYRKSSIAAAGLEDAWKGEQGCLQVFTGISSQPGQRGDDDREHLDILPAKM